MHWFTAIVWCIGLYKIMFASFFYMYISESPTDNFKARDVLYSLIIHLNLNIAINVPK